MTGVPGRLYIRPIFGLDMMGIGQPGRLRHPSGSKFHDRLVTWRAAQAFEEGLGRLVVYALIICFCFLAFC